MLTIKQEKFCIEYARTGKARQSYKAAGYKNKSDKVVDAAASRLLSNVRVKKRLEELATEVKNSKIADVQEMQEKLTAIIRQEMQEDVVVVEGCGDGISEARLVNKTPSTKEVISAITTLGKMQGAFIERVDANVDMDLNIVIDYGDEDQGSGPE